MNEEAIQRLTAAMAAGDRAAVASFYEQHFNWLFLEAKKACGRDESFCLDVVQEAMLRIIRTVRRAENNAQFFAWMRLVIRTSALDLMRRDRNRARRESLVSVSEINQVDSILEEEEDQQKRRNWLEKQIAAIDPHIVELINLRFEKNFTLQKIAEMFGLPIGNIDGRIRRALAKLRTAAQKEFDE